MYPFKHMDVEVMTLEMTNIPKTNYSVDTLQCPGPVP